MDNYRVLNARITNSSRFPNGYLYILKLKGFDLYKIGVSRNVKRRIRDIKGTLPFDSVLLYSEYFNNVYNLENQIHVILKDNNLRKEWFCLHNSELKQLTEILNNEISTKQIALWN